MDKHFDTYISSPVLVMRYNLNSMDAADIKLFFAEHWNQPLPIYYFERLELTPAEAFNIKSSYLSYLFYKGIFFKSAASNARYTRTFLVLKPISDL